MSKREQSCPTCGEKSVSTGANRSFPFCSERCQLVDLGRWLDGDYCIAGSSSPTGYGDDDEGYM